MTARTKWTIAATLLILLYGLGVVWWWNSIPDPSYDPKIWNQYKLTHLEEH